MKTSASRTSSPSPRPSDQPPPSRPPSRTMISPLEAVVDPVRALSGLTFTRNREFAIRNKLDLLLPELSILNDVLTGLSPPKEETRIFNKEMRILFKWLKSDERYDETVLNILNLYIQKYCHKNDKYFKLAINILEKSMYLSKVRGTDAPLVMLIDVASQSFFQADDTIFNLIQNRVAQHERIIRDDVMSEMARITNGLYQLTKPLLHPAAEESEFKSQDACQLFARFDLLSRLVIQHSNLNLEPILESCVTVIPTAWRLRHIDIILLSIKELIIRNKLFRGTRETVELETLAEEKPEEEKIVDQWETLDDKVFIPVKVSLSTAWVRELLSQHEVKDALTYQLLTDLATFNANARTYHDTLTVARLIIHLTRLSQQKNVIILFRRINERIYRDACVCIHNGLDNDESNGVQFESLQIAIGNLATILEVLSSEPHIPPPAQNKQLDDCVQTLHGIVEQHLEHNKSNFKDGVIYTVVGALLLACCATILLTLQLLLFPKILIGISIGLGTVLFISGIYSIYKNLYPEDIYLKIDDFLNLVPVFQRENTLPSVGIRPTRAHTTLWSDSATTSLASSQLLAERTMEIKKESHP